MSEDLQAGGVVSFRGRRYDVNTEDTAADIAVRLAKDNPDLQFVGPTVTLSGSAKAKVEYSGVFPSESMAFSDLLLQVGRGSGKTKTVGRILEQAFYSMLEEYSGRALPKYMKQLLSAPQRSLDPRLLISKPTHDRLLDFMPRQELSNDFIVFDELAFQVEEERRVFGNSEVQVEWLDDEIRTSGVVKPGVRSKLNSFRNSARLPSSKGLSSGICTGLEVELAISFPLRGWRY